MALIGGATAAWASYEKQVSQLNAQAAVLNRSQIAQERTFKDYTNSVKALRTEFGTTTAEAAKLTQTLAKVTSLRQTRELGSLSKVFVEMSKATGESSDGLASSLTNLEKVMGADINTRNTRKYADTFTYLAAQTQTSAQGLIDFTTQLAPTARTMGLSTKQVAGFATAFTKAGAEGTNAANIFTKITSDISKSIASGSPEIAHYANLVGKTQQQFKKMDSAEQIVEIFESLQRMGPRAATELNRLGLDGVRSMRSISAVINEAGGIREALNLAEGGKGATGRGAKGSEIGIHDEMDKLKQDIQMSAESFGSTFGPGVEKFLQGMEKMASVAQKVVEGPLGKFAALIAGILAPLAGGAGAMLLFAGALLKVASAFTLFRSSGAYGMREGFKGGSAITRNADGTYSGGGARGSEIAKSGTWFQRGLYNSGQATGSMFSSYRDRYIAERMRLNPEYQPRGVMATAAQLGGAGLRTFVNPLYDQMRFRDATERTQYIQNQVAPWTKAADASRLGRAMGTTGMLQERLAAQRAETIRIHADPLLTDDERNSKLAAARQMREETQQKINSSLQQEKAAQTVINNQKVLGTETEKTAKGFRGAAQGLKEWGQAQAGAMKGGMGTGIRAFAKSDMAMPAAGMLALGGMSAAGVHSNMMNMAAMGAMFGNPYTIAAGAAVGGTIDMVQANNEIGDSINALNETAAAAGKGDAGLATLAEQSDKTKESLDKWTKEHASTEGVQEYGFIRDPQRFFGQTKNFVEGLFGQSDEEELQEQYDKAKTKQDRVEGAIRDMAGLMGQKIQGTDSAQIAQLDQFMSEKGQARLAQLGFTLDDLTKAKQEGRTGDYEAMMAKIGAGTTVASDRLRGTAAGQAMMDSNESQKAMRYQENVSQFYEATSDIFKTLRDSGMNNQQIIRSTQRTQSLIGDPNSREYELQLAVQQRAQQYAQWQQPFQTRTAGFQSQLGAMRPVLMSTPHTDEQRERFEQTKGQFVQTVTEQYQYFQQLLYQKREFDVSQERSITDFGVQRDRMEEQYNLSRQRSLEDYNLSRKRSEFDFQLSRERAETDYNLTRKRAQADYDQSVRRSRTDFNLSRKRQEQDFNHQVVMMAEQSAKQMYNIYDRVQVESVNSATYLLSNAGDQLERMRDQSKNLDQLRAMGVSDNVIQQMGLTDPQNAQQLQQFVADLSNDPKLVKQFNKQIKERLKAARTLVTDESSSEWEEFTRQYNLSRRRAQEDFEKSVTRGHKDFLKQMNRQEEDFKKQMNRGAEDYERAQTRQQEDFSKSMRRGAHDYGVAVDQMTTDFHKSMRRAQADLERSAEEITGNLTTMLKKATNELGGNASDQAASVLKALRGLRRDAGAEGNDLMELMSEIFGFKFTPAKVHVRKPGEVRPGHGDSNSGGNVFGADISGFSGGVLPGYSPNRDIHQFHSATGGDLHLSGGEAIMVPEWTRMIGGPAAVARENAKARSGGSQVFRRQPGEGVIGDSANPATGYAAGGVLDKGQISRAKQFAMSKVAPGDQYNMGSVGPVFYDCSGFMSSITNVLRGLEPYHRLGATSTFPWAGFVKGPGQFTIGSTPNYGGSGIGHMAGTLAGLNVESRGGEGPITGPSARGYRDPGFNEIYHLGEGGDFGGGWSSNIEAGPTRRQQLQRILKDRYPRVEEAAAKFKLLGGFPDGWWSKKINQMARQAARRMAPNVGGGHIGSGPDGTNQELVHKAMVDQGWHQWPSLYQLVMHESGFNNQAQNPSSSAYGMFQFLDDTWGAYGGHKTSDPWKQAVLGMRYIKSRYGDPKGAWDFWQSHDPHWYANGGVFDTAQTIGIGEKGPEAVIPLNERGADFMSEIMRKTSSGLHGKGVGLTGSTPLLANTIHNYRIDRSTTFTGDITVQANNPGELIQQLRARQRVQALSRAALGGTRA